MTPFEYKLEMYNNYRRGNTYHTMRNPDNDTTSGNHHVINATHHVIAKKIGILITQDEEFIKQFIIDSRDVSGVINRAPTKYDHQTHDDLVCISVSSKLLNWSFAKEIAEEGNEGFIPWYFDNTEESTNFEFKNWHGRFPWAVFTYRHCADMNVNWFHKLGYKHYLKDSMKNKDLTDTSGRILRFIQNEAARGIDKGVDEVIKEWEEDLLKKYPGGMGEVLGIYHGKDHPFSKVMWGKV